MGNIWISSDLHFNHNRDFVYKARGYSDIYEMNKDIINKWNSVVNSEDEAFILGDIMLGDLDEGMRCLHQLKGKLHVIRGNHDTNNRAEAYQTSWNVIDVKYADVLKAGHWGFYLSHYPTLCSNYNYEKCRRGIISLCGHTHTKDKFLDMDKGLIYHCEVDAHNGFPAAIEDVKNDIRGYLNI